MAVSTTVSSEVIAKFQREWNSLRTSYSVHSSGKHIVQCPSELPSEEQSGAFGFARWCKRVKGAWPSPVLYEEDKWKLTFEDDNAGVIFKLKYL